MATVKTLEYKGYPLRRKGGIIYYGNMSDKYIIMLQILDSENFQDISLSKKVSVQLQLTDPNLKSRERVVKKTEKDGLFNAIDVAAVWLTRALASE